MIKTKSKLRNIFVLLFIVTLTGCAFTKGSINDLSEVGQDEVLFIGRLALDPPIAESEVQLENFINLSDIPVHKSLQMKVSDIPYKLGGQAAWEYQNSIFVVDGDYYYFSWEKGKPLNVLGVTFITRSTQANRDTMTLTIKDGIKVTHSGKSKAVYIGDITFVRDEFFNIKDINVSQKDYKKAVKVFREKYKGDWKVEQAKLSSSR